MSARIPGWEGSLGPQPSEYAAPHVYARDINSGAGNCVCGANLHAARHVQAAPGVPIPRAADEVSAADSGRGDLCAHPHLGLASTADMLIELLGRAEVEMAINGSEPAEVRAHAAKMLASARALLAELPADLLSYRAVDP